MINLKPLANTPTSDLTTEHLEQTLTASCSRCWPTCLKKRDIPKKYSTCPEMYASELQGSTLVIVLFKYCTHRGTEFYFSQRTVLINSSLIINEKSENKQTNVSSNLVPMALDFLIATSTAMIVTQMFCTNWTQVIKR